MTELDIRPTTNGEVDPLEELTRLGVLRNTGLYLAKPDISYEQLETVGAALASRYHSVRFAVGDWLLLVEAMFPERLGQAFEVLGISPEGASEFMRVATKVPRSIRRGKLSWSHHRAVASLSVVDSKTSEVKTDHKAQKEWLARAEDEQMSHHQLRDALRADEPPPAVRTCRCCHRPL